MNIFSKLRLISKFCKKNQIFSKFLINLKFSEIFGNFDQNRIFFGNLTKLVIFRKFYQTRNFSNFWKKSQFFRIFDWYRNFFKNLTNTEIFWKFRTKSKFCEILTKCQIFGNCSKICLESKFFELFEKLEIFSKNLTKIELFFKYLTKIKISRKFLPKEKLFQKFDYRNFSKILTKIEI